MCPKRLSWDLHGGLAVTPNASLWDTNCALTAVCATLIILSDACWVNLSQSSDIMAVGHLWLELPRISHHWYQGHHIMFSYSILSLICQQSSFFHYHICSCLNQMYLFNQQSNVKEQCIPLSTQDLNCISEKLTVSLIFWWQVWLPILLRTYSYHITSLSVCPINQIKQRVRQTEQLGSVLLSPCSWPNDCDWPSMWPKLWPSPQVIEVAQCAWRLIHGSVQHDFGLLFTLGSTYKMYMWKYTNIIKLVS